MKRSNWIYLVVMTLSVVTNNCSGIKRGKHTNHSENPAGCPNRPNCVSSLAQDAAHAVKPFRLNGDPAVSWRAIQDAVDSLPRTTIIKASEHYLHAICKSRLFGFIDDLELQLDPKTGVIAIRSASRIGYFDLGVNRRRVESLRQQLKGDALIQ